MKSRSNSPVIGCADQGYREIGDLAKMPESVKRKIRLGTFTYCDYYSHRKTRLSQDGYKEVGAIVAGTTDPNVCQDFIRR